MIEQVWQKLAKPIRESNPIQISWSLLVQVENISMITWPPVCVITEDNTRLGKEPNDYGRLQIFVATW